MKTSAVNIVWFFVFVTLDRSNNEYSENSDKQSNQMFTSRSYNSVAMADENAQFKK